MKITLDKIVPHPLKSNTSHSSVWGKILEIEEGTICEINAASARGKTTLISIIYGLRFDYEGDVILDGKSIRSIDEKEWPGIRNTSLSILFQDLRLFDFLTGEENILVKSGIADSSNAEQMSAMAERLEVSVCLKKTVRELSFGEKQRIAIIRALSQPYRFILLDEPWSHLDKKHAKEASALILERSVAQKAAIVCTTLDKSDMFPFDEMISV
jgi:ABC-type lipoprotein export system ATPase subunit